MNEKELKIINATQNEYEDLLIEKITRDDYVIKKINFSSPTGTGKTKMMADVIEKMSEDYFFVITTLSKGQLSRQINVEITRFTNKANWLVFGLNDFTKNTILQADDILAKIPSNKKLIWFRDEGHINTNRWMEILEEKSFKIVNISATNKTNSDDDIRCNFNHTMMLRTVVQNEGEPKDALDKLLEVKQQHKAVKDYNPCAIFRVLDENILGITIRECKKRKLKYINITDENYDMSDLCKDDNEYDVIINKFKIVEGIDIRRAHVLYMTNEPKNPSTTIQVIGRCRRNALLYRNDLDILAPENKELLEKTRICYCFYNIKGMNIETDENGDLISVFCNIISVQELKTGAHILVQNGVMPNGLEVYEANGETSEFDVVKDQETGFNVLSPNTAIYANNPYKYVLCESFNKLYLFDINDVKKLTMNFFGSYDLFEEKNEKYVLSKERKSDFINYLKGRNSVEFKVDYNPINKYPYIVTIYNINIVHYFRSEEYYDIESVSNEFLYEKLKREDRGNAKIRRFRTEKELDDYRTRNGFKPFDTDYIFMTNVGNVDVTYYHEQGTVINPIKTYPVTDLDMCFKKYGTSSIYVCRRFDDLRPLKAFNDKELSIIGIDTFKLAKKSYIFDWCEDKTISSKINKNSKFNQFITKKYKNILNSISEYAYHKNNKIFKTNKFNSMLGYCVEYFAKFVIRFKFDYEYRDNTIKLFYIFFKDNRSAELKAYKTINMVAEGIFKEKNQKLREMFRSFVIRERVISAYQHQMKLCYNLPGSKIPSMSYHSLIKESEFVETIRDYGTKNCSFFNRIFWD